VPRARRTRKALPAPPSEALPAWARTWMLTGEKPSAGSPDNVAFCRAYFGYRCTPGDDLRDVWRREGAALTDEWVREHPGSRPYAWWLWSAPDHHANGEDESEARTLRRIKALRPGELGRIPPEAFDAIEPEPDPRDILGARPRTMRGGRPDAA
jgi:hypothetical protein